MRYAVYEPATGRILKHGHCPRDHVRLQGEHVLELPDGAEVDDERDLIVEGPIYELGPNNSITVIARCPGLKRGARNKE